MTLDLFLNEHPQIQDVSTPIGCLKELLNYHWLLLKTCVEIANRLCSTWAPFRYRRAGCVSFRCGYLNARPMNVESTFPLKSHFATLQFDKNPNLYFY
jgi:hypothetical protein